MFNGQFENRLDFGAAVSMRPDNNNLNEVWSHLQGLVHEAKSLRLAEEFAKTPQRAELYSVEVSDKLFFDYSKNLLSTQIMESLLDLGRKSSLSDYARSQADPFQLPHVFFRSHMDDLSGKTNVEESREATEFFSRIKEICRRVRSGLWTACTGEKFRHILCFVENEQWADSLKMVAEVIRDSDIIPCMIECSDREAIDAKILDKHESVLETTLVVILGTVDIKRLTKIAEKIDKLLGAGLEGEKASQRHLLPVVPAARKRLSAGSFREAVPVPSWMSDDHFLWGIGAIPLAVSSGFENYIEFCAGGHFMDEHTRKARTSENIPLIMALIRFWYDHFLDADARVCLPFDERLAFLPSHVRQLEVHLNQSLPPNDRISLTSSALLGTREHNNLIESLHEPLSRRPADIILVAKRDHPAATKQHDKLTALGIGHGEALMLGRSIEDATEKVTKVIGPSPPARELAMKMGRRGNKPTSTFIVGQLTAFSLGMLLAMYEQSLSSTAYLNFSLKNMRVRSKD